MATVIVQDKYHAYLAWPNIVKVSNVKTSKTRLIVTFAGKSDHHYLCPWGSPMMVFSDDGGETWSQPKKIVNTHMLNTSGSIIEVSPNKLLFFFSSIDLDKNTDFTDGNHLDRDHPYALSFEKWKYLRDLFKQYYNNDSEFEERYGWKRMALFMDIDGDLLSSYNDYKFIELLNSSPHGGIKTSYGDTLLRLGEDRNGVYHKANNNVVSGYNPLTLYRSQDSGLSWEKVNIKNSPQHNKDMIPVSDASIDGHDRYSEPHIVECGDGTYLAMFRNEVDGGNENNQSDFDKMFIGQSRGRWVNDYMEWDTILPALDKNGNKLLGYPPHLYRLDDDRILLTYGYRRWHKKFIFFWLGGGIRARISNDNGNSWGDEIILFSQALVPHLYNNSQSLVNKCTITINYNSIPVEKVSIIERLKIGDLGYPASVQLSSNKILTVFYMRPNRYSRPCITSVEWKLPP